MHSDLTDRRFHLEAALSSSILYDTEAKIDVGCPENIGPSQSPICTAIHLYCENLSIFRIVFAFFFFFFYILTHPNSPIRHWSPLAARLSFSLDFLPVPTTFFSCLLSCHIFCALPFLSSFDFSTAAANAKYLNRSCTLIYVRKFSSKSSEQNCSSKIIKAQKNTGT